MTSFNDVGFLSVEYVPEWEKVARNEFARGFEIAEKMNRLAMRILFELPTENIDDAQVFATAAYGRALQSFQIAVLLAIRCALAEARAVVRLCTEAVIAVGSLKCGALTADLLGEDHDYHRRAHANAVLEGVDGQEPGDPEANRLRAIVTEIDGRYPQGTKPKKINWDTLARKSKLKPLYDIVYRSTSGDAAHLNVGSLNRHAIADDNNELLGFRFAPENADVRETVSAANWCLVHLLGFIVDWFPLTQFHTDLTACIDDWKKIADEPSIQLSTVT